MRESAWLVLVAMSVGACSASPAREDLIPPPMEVAGSFRSFVDSSLPSLKIELARVGYSVGWAFEDSVRAAHVDHRTLAELAQQKYWATAAFELIRIDSTYEDRELFLELKFGSFRGAAWALVTTDGYATQPQVRLEPRLDTRTPIAVERAILAVFSKQVERGFFAQLREPGREMPLR